MDWFLTPASTTGRDLYPRLPRAVREARVLQEREGARRGVPPLRLLHDRNAPGTSASTCPGSARTGRRWTCTATSRASAARAGPTTTGAGTVADEVRRARSAGVRVARRSSTAASSTAPTSWRRWRRASPSASWATSATTATSPTCPHGCCVEVPTFADDTGLHPTRVGDLPPQCAALCHDQHQRADAGRRGRRCTATRSASCRPSRMDPLTGAVCTLKEIREMCSGDAGGRSGSGCRSSRGRRSRRSRPSTSPRARRPWRSPRIPRRPSSSASWCWQRRSREPEVRPSPYL